MNVHVENGLVEIKFLEGRGKLIFDTDPSLSVRKIYYPLTGVSYTKNGTGTRPKIRD